MNLTKLTKKELLEIAQKKKIPNRTKMTKEELIAAIEPLYSTETTATPKTAAQPGYAVKDEKPKQAPIKKDEYPIPPYYNVNTLNFMPVDPTREYVYWEISDTTLSKIQSELRLSSSNLLLKVFMKSGKEVSEAASVSVERIGNWYFNIYAPETEMWSEIGLLDSNGAFHSILKSNTVKMPANKVSEVVDNETWMTVSGDLDKIYQLSGVGMKEEMNSASIFKEVTRQMSQNIASSGALKDR